MAQAQHYPPRSYSPPSAAPSPRAGSPAGSFLPPNKRQRLSPKPQMQSPYSSPSFSHPQLPNNGNTVNGFNAPPQNMNTSSGPGSMGPPSRPNEKATDTTELADVLASSGVDLREEEALLTQPYLNSNMQYNQTSFNANSFNTNAGSFLSQGSSNGIPSGGSFQEYASIYQPGPANTFYGAGPYNQPAVPYKSPEEIAQEQKRIAERKLAERRQYHLNYPFLDGRPLDKKIRDITYKHGAQPPGPNTVFHATKLNDGKYPSADVESPDGSVITIYKGEAIVDRNSPLVDIISLLSLACEEHVRGLVEDAAALAKGRQTGSQGVVPAEWTDLALEGGADAQTASTAKGGWDSAMSPKSNTLKRTHSEANIRSATTPRAQSNPISLPNALASTLRSLTSTARNFEEARIARRNRRTSSAPADGAPSRANSISTPGTPGTPGGPGLIAPDALEYKKPTKKELKRQAELRATEAQQHEHTNATVAMALGGITSKKYDWLNKAKKAPGSGFGTGVGMGRLNTNVGSGSGTSTPKGNAGPGGLPPGTGSRIGEFREDGRKGEGLQMRDLLVVMEADGKEKKTLTRALLKLKQG
ncbi:MAG: hypothetical protein M1834_006036 [Cirrosporium novae-zelandiae]|nr:MAG: hypothetical protein M1834_006036 [Cirrosporium novae-zelandiae]